jgi:molybdenum cofactor cytidylyltransferase
MTGSRIGGILLAAGGSTRYGSPKQLAQYKGKTLIRISAEAIADCGCSPAVVVLGSHANESLAEINGLNIRSVINSDWQTGMSSSIRAGLSELLKIDPEIDAVLITLMDQPLVTSKHLAKFVERFDDTHPPVIAAKYQDVTGVPALFSRDLFDELFKLGGDRGARAVIRNQDDLMTIDVEEAAVDVDSLPDLKKLPNAS